MNTQENKLEGPVELCLCYSVSVFFALQLDQLVIPDHLDQTAHRETKVLQEVVETLALRDQM